MKGVPKHEAIATRQLCEQFDEYAILVSAVPRREKHRKFAFFYVGKDLMEIEAVLIKEVSYYDFRNKVTVTLKPGLRIKSSLLRKGDGVTWETHFADIDEGLATGYYSDCVALTGATNLEAYSYKAMAWLIFSRLCQINAAAPDRDTPGITVKADPKPPAYMTNFNVYDFWAY